VKYLLDLFIHAFLYNTDKIIFVDVSTYPFSTSWLATFPWAGHVRCDRQSAPHYL